MKYIATSLLRNFWHTEHSVTKSEFSTLNTSFGSQPDNLLKFSMSGRFFSNQFGEEVWASTLDRLNLKFNLRNMFETAGLLKRLTFGLEPCATSDELNFVWLSRLFLSQQQINWGVSGQGGRGTLPYNWNFLSIQILRRALLIGERNKLSSRSLYFGGYVFASSSEAYLSTPTFKSKLSTCCASVPGRFFLLWELAHWAPSHPVSSLSRSMGCLDSELHFALTGRSYFLRSLTLINREYGSFRYSLLPSISLVTLSPIFFCWLPFHTLLAAWAKQIASILFMKGFLCPPVVRIFFNSWSWSDRLIVSPAFRKYGVVRCTNLWGDLNLFKLTFLGVIEKYIRKSSRFDSRSSLSLYTRRFARLFDWFSSLLGGFNSFINKENKFVSVGLNLSRVRKHSFKNTLTLDRFSGVASSTVPRYSLVLSLFASLGPYFLWMTRASWVSANDLSFGFNYKWFFYLRRILGAISLYNREVLAEYARLNGSNARGIRTFVALSYCDTLSPTVSDSRSSATAWLAAQHTAWVLNAHKVGLCSRAGFDSVGHEDRMVAFSNIGWGGVHADFFFFTSFENLLTMRTFLGETMLALGTFKVDNLFDHRRSQFLTLDVFGSASTRMLKSMLYRGSDNFRSAALSRLAYRANVPVSFLHFPWNNRRFFFNSLDSDRVGLGGSVQGMTPPVFLFGEVSAVLNYRTSASKLWGIVNTRRYISLRRLHFKRKRLHTSARLYWCYRFERVFFSF